MANKGVVLRLESMDPIPGSPDLSVLYFTVALRKDTGENVTTSIPVTIDWTGTVGQINANIITTIKDTAQGMGYTLGNNQLWVPTFSRQ